MSARLVSQSCRWIGVLGYAVAVGAPNYLIAVSEEYGWDRPAHLLLPFYVLSFASVLIPWVVLPRLADERVSDRRRFYTKWAAVLPATCVLIAVVISWLDTSLSFWLSLGMPAMPMLGAASLLAVVKPREATSTGLPEYPTVHITIGMVLIAVITITGLYLSLPATKMGPIAGETWKRTSGAMIYKHRVATPHFELHTDLALPLERLAEVAERTRSITREWLALQTETLAENNRVSVFICSDTNELLNVEQFFRGSPRRSYNERAPWLPVACYYPDVGVITILNVQPRLEELLSHEVVHCVVRALAPNCPDVINEGAALLLSERLLIDDPGFQSYRTGLRARRAEVCARALEEGEVPSVAQMFRLGYGEFRSRTDHLYFHLSWCLVRALDAHYSRGLPAFFRLMGAGESPWECFSRVFPIEEVEAHWLAEVKRVAG